MFTGVSGCCQGGGDVAVGGDAEADVLGSACGGQVGLGELVVGCSEADLESRGLAGPALALGLDDAGQEVVADAFEAAALCGVDPQQGAPDTGLTEIILSRDAIRPRRSV
jgi:hypothetical protein